MKKKEEKKHPLDEIPLDVLTDKDAMNRFLEILLSKQEFIKKKLAEMDEDRKEGEAQLAFFMDKTEILTKYTEFMGFSGFAIAKKTVEQYGEEIRQAKKDRLTKQQEAEPWFTYVGPEGSSTTG